MQIPPFASLYKYGFWSHERTHSIVRQNGQKMVDFGNEVLINQLDDWSALLSKKLARVNDVNTVTYWLYRIHFIPTNMVRTTANGNVRMRKRNTKTTVPLDVEPERRTKRFPPRFRPVDCFCKLRFRYLSSPTGRERGRDKSAPRPYDPIHPLSSTRI